VKTPKTMQGLRKDKNVVKLILNEKRF